MPFFFLEINKPQTYRHVLLFREIEREELKASQQICHQNLSIPSVKRTRSIEKQMSRSRDCVFSFSTTARWWDAQNFTLLVGKVNFCQSRLLPPKAWGGWRDICPVCSPLKGLMDRGGSAWVYAVQPVHRFFAYLFLMTVELVGVGQGWGYLPAHTRMGVGGTV